MVGQPSPSRWSHTHGYIDNINWIQLSIKKKEGGKGERRKERKEGRERERNHYKIFITIYHSPIHVWRRVLGLSIEEQITGEKLILTQSDQGTGRT